jgi:pimeloyl-ACP methyl ester carboxylesterase
MYEVTYPSGLWRVKGYLVWPDEFRLPADIGAVWKEAVFTVLSEATTEQAGRDAAQRVRGANVVRVPGSVERWAGELWIPPSCRPQPQEAAYDARPASDVRPEGSNEPVLPAPALLRVGWKSGTHHMVWSGARLPAVVFCRGGIGRVGAVRKHWIAHWALTQRCVVFAPCYRGNEGSEGRDEFGGSDVDDVRMAVRIVRALPFVRDDAVYLVGFSRGAINAMAAAAVPAPDTVVPNAASDATCGVSLCATADGAPASPSGHEATSPVPVTPPVSAVAVWGGVSDLAAVYEERVDLRRMLRRVVGGTPRRVPERYRARSPALWAERVRCPVVVVHGTNDRQVDVGHAKRLIEALTRAGNPPVVHLYEGVGHHLPPLLHDAVVTRLMEALLAASRCKAAMRPSGGPDAGR